MAVGARPDAPHAHWKPPGLCSSRAAAPVEGVWRVVARTIPATTSPTERSDPFAHVPVGRHVDVQPGLLIFSKSHYRRVTDTAVRPRPRGIGATAGRTTVSELQDRWGPFQANAGTYEVAGDVLTLRVIVAKDPEA